MIRILAFMAVLFTATASSAQEIDLSDCRIGAGESFPTIKARCGLFSRPLNPADPDSELIELSVAVVPALSLSPEPDPFVPIAGGPGQASIEFYGSFARAFERVRRTRDILLIDQRGTGGSAQMTCDVDDDIVEGAYSPELTLAVTKECLDKLPHDPRFFTTSVAVQDLEAVREALGYAQLNVYGISYGSRVAQHFARRHPQSTRTIVIDGVVPPQISLGPEIATESQRAIERVLERCSNNEHCNARFPDIQQQFDDLRARLVDSAVDVLMQHPVNAELDTEEFGTEQFALAIRLLLYSPRTIALMPLLISEAANGNYQPLAAQFQMTAEALVASLSIGMHNAVMCTEDLPFIDWAVVDNDAIAASYMGPIQLEAMQTMCSIWPAGPIDEGFKAPLETDIPVLLLSGDADPITPPRYAELALEKMTNYRHLVGPDQGHGQAPVGCMPRLIGQFVDTLVLSDEDVACVDESFAMPFFVGFSGPAP